MANIKVIIILILLISSCLLVVFSANSNTVSNHINVQPVITSTMYKSILYENVSALQFGRFLSIKSSQNIHNNTNIANANSIPMSATVSSYPEFTINFILPKTVIQEEQQHVYGGQINGAYGLFVPNIYAEISGYNLSSSGFFINYTIIVDLENDTSFTFNLSPHMTLNAKLVFLNEYNTALFTIGSQGAVLANAIYIDTFKANIQTRPNIISYDRVSFQQGSEYIDPTYNVIMMYGLNTTSIVYNVNFYANETNTTSFYILVNGYNFSSTSKNELSLSFPNGTYYLNVILIKYKDINGTNHTYYDKSIQGYFVINGNGLSINLITLSNSFVSVVLYFYIFIIVMILTILIVLKFSQGNFVPSILTINIFLLIGFELNLEYFTNSLIASFMAIIIGIFVYYAVLK